MPLILSGNVASALGTGYDVANSCRFDGSAARLSRTTGVTTTNTKFTLSFWIKMCDITNHQMIFETYKASGEYLSCGFNLDNSGQPRFYIQEYTGSYIFRKIFTRISRDTSAWSHYCIKYDSTESEATRLRVYVNGTEDTVTTTANLPSSNATSIISVGTQYIGYSENQSGHYLNAYLAEFVLVEGTDYAPTSFGEFNEDSPQIWQPIDVSGLTFGTNGFYLDFEDSGDLGDDESGNGHDFSETSLSTYDQTTDVPTNNFATFNSLIRVHSSMSLAEGNLKATTGNAYMDNGSNSFFSTIGMTAGKWYWEVKVITAPSTAGLIGVAFDLENFHQRGTSVDAYNLSYTTKGYSYSGAGGIGNDGGGWGVSGESTYTANDIISIALDMDNHKLYAAKNGTWQNSGDPESGATGTGAVSIASGYTYFFGLSDNAGSAVYVYEANFGNPPYSNSSSVADANGYGAFEYSVPSGYLALCSKNLGESGG